MTAPFSQSKVEDDGESEDNNPILVVSKHHDEEANGEYVFCGMERNKMSWKKKANDEWQIYWNGKKWKLRNKEQGTYYVQFAGTDFPPVSGWVLLDTADKNWSSSGSVLLSSPVRVTHTTNPSRRKLLLQQSSEGNLQTEAIPDLGGLSTRLLFDLDLPDIDDDGRDVIPMSETLIDFEREVELANRADDNMGAILEEEEEASTPDCDNSST